MSEKSESFCLNLEMIAVVNHSMPIDDRDKIRKAAEIIRRLCELVDTYEELNAELKEENYRLEERIGMMIDR